MGETRPARLGQGKTNEGWSSQPLVHPSTHLRAVMTTQWKTVELRTIHFHRSVVVAIASQGNAPAEDLFFELAPFHAHVYATECYRWLDIHGTHNRSGLSRVLSLGRKLFPNAALLWITGERFKVDPAASLPGRVDIQSRHTMANIPFLTAYLLLVTVEGDEHRASGAKELLHLMTSLRAYKLTTSCAVGSLVIDTRGVSGSLDDCPFLSVMADACQEAECRSPIPGPLDTPTTWIILTKLACWLEQSQHDVLQLVQEWSLTLLAWLCAGLYAWCQAQVDPSTHLLLATQRPGRGGQGALLRQRLSVKKHQRSPEGMER